MVYTTWYFIKSESYMKGIVNKEEGKENSVLIVLIQSTHETRTLVLKELSETVSVSTKNRE